MFLKILQNLQENTCAKVNKVADLRPAALLKKRLWQGRFPVNFAKFLRTPFLPNTSGQQAMIDFDLPVGFRVGFI